MGDKSERRAAREAVASYHEGALTDLAEHVSEAVDRFRAGSLDAFELDRVIHQYHRAAKELWKVCTLNDVEFTASLIARGDPIDWWERGSSNRG